MGEEFDLSDLRFLRLFPLPGVFLFPHAVLPLHIFEPRYRQMTEDSLASDRFITIVDAFPPDGGPGTGPPRLAECGCVGRIIKHERLDDGRFNFLLLGLARVRLLNEVPSGRLYRTSEAEVVLDSSDVAEEPRLVESLAAQFRRFLERSGRMNPDFDAVLNSGLSLGELTDIIAYGAPLSRSIKAVLLAECRPESRSEILSKSLAEILGADPVSQPIRRGFPPSFSSN